MTDPDPSDGTEGSDASDLIENGTGGEGLDASEITEAQENNQGLELAATDTAESPEESPEEPTEEEDTPSIGARIAAAASWPSTFTPERSMAAPLSKQRGHRIGARVGAAIAGQLSGFVLNIMVLVSRLVPGSQRFWEGMLAASYKGLLKKSGADAIGHIAEQGRISHKPVAWDPQKRRWVTQEGEYWNASGKGDQYLVAKNIPAVWATGESTELGSNVQAEVAEVLDLGKTETVYQSANVQHTIVQPPAADGGGKAVADGGTATTSEFEEHVDVLDPGSLSDVLVPLDNLYEGAKGRVVSMDKYYETYPSVTDPDEMKKQEDRGRLAEMDPGAEKAFVIKVLLIVMGAVAVWELGPHIVQALFGGGSSGGGLGISLFLSLPF